MVQKNNANKLWYILDLFWPYIVVYKIQREEKQKRQRKLIKNAGLINNSMSIKDLKWNLF